MWYRLFSRFISILTRKKIYTYISRKIKKSNGLSPRRKYRGVDDIFFIMPCPPPSPPPKENLDRYPCFIRKRVVVRDLIGPVFIKFSYSYNKKFLKTFYSIETHQFVPSKFPSYVPHTHFSTRAHPPRAATPRQRRVRAKMAASSLLHR